MKYASLPIEELHTWAQFNGVAFNNIAIAKNIASKDGVDKGAGLVATTGFSDSGASQQVLLTVPADLVLSKETVHLCAKADLQLNEVLVAVGSFAEVGYFLFHSTRTASPTFEFDRKRKQTMCTPLITYSHPGQQF
jgi:hypothetical protein